jgi:hypothetical protein
MRVAAIVVLAAVLAGCGGGSGHKPAAQTRTDGPNPWATLFERQARKH